MKSFVLIFLWFSCAAARGSTSGSASYLETVVAPSKIPRFFAVKFMAKFFQDVKTIHLFNIRDESSISVSAHVKHFHERLEMSFTVTTTDHGTINTQHSQNAINSHAEAYLVYVNTSTEYSTILQTVKSTNPLARCLFMLRRGSYERAVAMLQMAWTRLELFNIVIALMDKQNKFVWCIFNPFNGKHHNLAVSSNALEYLADLRELNNFNGFPVTITIPHLQGKIFTKFPAGVNILQTIFKMINASCKFAAGGYKHGKDMQTVDIDSYPQLLHDVSSSNVIFLNPLKQAEIFAAAPKNRQTQKSPSDYLSTTKLFYRRAAMIFGAILAVFGAFSRKLFGPSLENEFTHLLLTGTGILYSFGTYPFRDTNLRLVAVFLMFTALVMNNVLLGSLVEHLNVPATNEIDSLSKLLSANVNIVTVPFIFYSLQHVTGDHMVQQIKTKLRIAPLPQDRKSPIFVEGRHAFLLPKEKAFSMAETMYDDEGNDLIHIVPEKVHVFYVGFVARRDLFMAWKINQLILQMAQHGVIQHEFSTMFTTVRLIKIKRVKQGMVAEVKFLTIGLRDISRVFPIIFIGYILSAFIFAFESMHYNFCRYLKRNNTNFREFGKEKFKYAMKRMYESTWKFIIFIKTMK